MMYIWYEFMYIKAAYLKSEKEKKTIINNSVLILQIKFETFLKKGTQQIQ